MIGESVALEFSSRINDHDPGGLAELMTGDHTFTTAKGTLISGRPACRHAWRAFFDAYPDYRASVESVTARGDLVLITGHAVCAQPDLAGPHLWTAVISDGLVSEWRCYQDTPLTRRHLAIPDSSA